MSSSIFHVRVVCPRRAFWQSWSFKIRRTTFLNYIKKWSTDSEALKLRKGSSGLNPNGSRSKFSCFWHFPFFSSWQHLFFLILKHEKGVLCRAAKWFFFLRVYFLAWYPWAHTWDLLHCCRRDYWVSIWADFPVSLSNRVGFTLWFLDCYSKHSPIPSKKVLSNWKWVRPQGSYENWYFPFLHQPLTRRATYYVLFSSISPLTVKYMSSLISNLFLVFHNEYFTTVWCHKLGTKHSKKSKKINPGVTLTNVKQSGNGNTPSNWINYKAILWDGLLRLRLHKQIKYSLFAQTVDVLFAPTHLDLPNLFEQVFQQLFSPQIWPVRIYWSAWLFCCSRPNRSFQNFRS